MESDSKTKNCVVLTVGCCQLHTIEIYWPVLRETEKAILVQLPDDSEMWVPRYGKHGITKLPHRFIGPTVSAAQVKAWRELGFTSDSLLIEVSKVGRGPTDKSAKFRFVVQFPVGYQQTETAERIFTLPVSWIQERDSRLYVSLGRLKEKLARDKIAERRQDEVACGDIWQPEASILNQLNTALLPLLAAHQEDEKRRQEQWALRREAMIKKRQKEEERQRELVAQREAEEKQRVERAAARGPRLPTTVIDPANVKYVVWERKKTSMKKIEKEAKWVRVEMFGKKVVIKFKDGQTLEKRVGPNLSIEVAEP